MIILDKVRLLRQPCIVLTQSLKNDIISHKWITTIIRNYMKVYSNAAHCLFWLESDVLEHLNDFSSMNSYISEDIYERCQTRNLQEVLKKLLVSKIDYKRNIFNMWNIMSFRKRKMFMSKYSWVNYC